MKKNKILNFSFFLLTILALSNIAMGAALYQLLPNTLNKQVNEQGTCKLLSNNSNITYLVPTNNTNDWNAFITNPHTGVTLTPCALKAGVNIPWFNYGNSFGDDGMRGNATGTIHWTAQYNATNAHADIDTLAANKMKIVRVWVYESLQGVLNFNTTCPGCFDTILTTASPLVTTHINNITDFVSYANSKGIQVGLTLFNAWDYIGWSGAIAWGAYPAKGGYATFTINNNAIPDPHSVTTLFTPASNLYSTTGPLYKLGQAMAGKDVFWDFMNEGDNLAVMVTWPVMNTWIAKAKATLVAAGSTQRFTMSVNQSGSITGSGTSDSATKLNRNNLDFWDYHTYNDAGTIAINSSQAGVGGKPLILGEFGPSTKNWSTSTVNKTTLIDNFWNAGIANGFEGICIWSYKNDGSGNVSPISSAQMAELILKAP